MSKRRCDIVQMKGVDVKYMTEERKRYTFRLPKGLYLKLEQEAKKQGISINALMLKILWDWSERKNKA